jgi:membrane-associated phospholipid phosphatase
MTDQPGSANPAVAAQAVPLRRPNWPHVLLFMRENTWVTCLWLLIYGGANWITSLHTHRVRLWSDAELAIPFIPAAAIIYLSLIPMLWLSLFVLHTRDELRSFAKSLGLMIVISGIGFLALPSKPAYPTRSVEGQFANVFHFADVANLQYNMLPSLHVAMAVGCAFAYSACAGLRWAALWWTWSVAIALSTLVTYQHHVVDVVTGAMLGIGAVAVCGAEMTVNGNESITQRRGVRRE